MEQKNGQLPHKDLQLTSLHEARTAREDSATTTTTTTADTAANTSHETTLNGPSISCNSIRSRSISSQIDVGQVKIASICRPVVGVRRNNNVSHINELSTTLFGKLTTAKVT